jgi:hypothetical protein
LVLDHYRGFDFKDWLGILIKQKSNDQGNENGKDKEIPVPVNLKEHRPVIERFLLLLLAYSL